MWWIQQIGRRTARLDFSSSDQGSLDVTQLIADGKVLANAIELTDWSPPSAQWIICEDCGNSHCEPGGWVAARRTGSNVVLLPDFAQMEADDWALNEYRPPDYFGRGIPIIDEASAQAIPACRWPHELPLITGRELLRAIQWTAPMNVLGRFPEPPRIRRDITIATSEPSLESALDRLEAEIERQESNTNEVVLGAASSAQRPVCFYLDDPGGTEWVPGFDSEGEIALGLDRDLVALS